MAENVGNVVAQIIYPVERDLFRVRHQAKPNTLLCLGWKGELVNIVSRHLQPDQFNQDGFNREVPTNNLGEAGYILMRIEVALE